MKYANFLFFISIRRVGVLFTLNTLLLCLLIPLGSLMTGCGEDRDLDDLLEERLSICALDIADTSLEIGGATRLEVKLEEYEGDKAYLKYHWHVTGGEIHGTGKKVIYVAPRDPKDQITHTIICKVSNGVVTASEYREVTVTVPETSDTQKSSDASTNNDGETQ